MPAFRAYLLSLFLIFGGFGFISGAEAARYITTADNENNAGTGVPDNDMGSCIYNDDSRHPIEFNLNLSGALPTQNAYLSVFINDIDWPDEVDEIFLNGHSLGFAAGLNGVNNSTLFVLPDLSWVKAGKNLVQVRVDKNNVHSWCAAVVNGQLIIDEGLGLGLASIRSLAANAAAYNFGSAVNIDLDVDTAGTASQNVRLELILRDPNGTIIDFDRNSTAQSWPVTASNNEPYRWAFTLPGNGTSGLWSVTLGAYDVSTAELNATKTVSFAVPLTAASLPVVSGVTPATGSAGSAITISGQNFIQGGTTCTLGGMSVTNLVVVGGGTITGTIPALAAGLYALACSTRFGAASLPNAFSVAKNSQTITFGTAPTVTVGGTGSVSATASSGLAVAFSSLTTGICTVSGSTVAGVAAGTCTIAANQAGNSSYSPASQVTQSFTIAAAPTATNLLQNPGFESGRVVWTERTLRSSPIITNDISVPVHAGAYRAYLGGYYSGYDQLEQSVTIPANASSALLDFWYYIATNEIFPIDFDTLTVDLYNSAGSAKLSNIVDLSNLNATGVAWVKSSTSFDVSAFKGQTVRVRFTATNDSTGKTHFLIDDVALVVASSVKTPQTITFGPAPTVTVDGTGTLSATASSGLAVAFSSLSTPVCTVTGKIVTGIAAGICTLAANQAGDSTYAAAPQATTSFSVTANIVSPGAPTITSIKAGSGSATINFAPPGNTGGSPITRYTATCTASGQATRTATGTASPLTVRNLTGGVAYRCSVTATNGGDLSSASSATMAVTVKESSLTPILMLLLD